MTLKLLYNPTDSPVVIDAEGHTLGGGEWGVGDSRSEEVATGLTTSSLIVSGEPAADADPAAIAAWQQLQAAKNGDVQEPARSGAGSGKDAWAAYAGKRGIPITDDASRDDIIAAVDAAGQEQS